MADTSPPPLPSPGMIDMVGKLFSGGGFNPAAMLPTTWAAAVPFGVPAIMGVLSMLGNKTSQEPPTASMRFNYDDKGLLSSPQNDADRNTFWGDTLDDPFIHDAIAFGNYGRDILNPLLSQAGVQSPTLPEGAPTLWQGKYSFGGQEFETPNDLWRAYAQNIPGLGGQQIDDYFGGLKTNPDFWNYYNARYDNPSGYDTTNPERGPVPIAAPLTTDWRQMPNISGWTPAQGNGGAIPNQQTNSPIDMLAGLFPVAYLQPGGGGFAPAQQPSNWATSPTGTIDPAQNRPRSMTVGGETAPPPDYAAMWGLDPNLVFAGG